MRKPLVATASVLALALAAAVPVAAGPADGCPVFLGPDGAALPFASHAEIEAFLREARVVSSKAAPGGVTGARKLLLERGGVRAHAIFRSVQKTALVQQMPRGRVQPHFRDHHENEVAAYALARLLGLDTVPPAVARQLEGKRGSVQLWVEAAETEERFRRRELAPVERSRHALQVEQMFVFDNLIHNIDRNQGNYLTDPDGRVWWVDHTRSFIRLAVLPDPDRVRRVDRVFWERLKSVAEQEIVATLAPLLPEPEVRGVLERRHLVVSLLEERLAEKSEQRVLFHLARLQSPR